MKQVRKSRNIFKKFTSVKAIKSSAKKTAKLLFHVDKRHVKGSFSFGVSSLVLLGLLFFGSSGLAQLDKNGDAVVFNQFLNDVDANDPFFSQNKTTGIETPDLKIAQDSFIYGISTPRALTIQTLGSVMGTSEPQPKERNEIVDYTAQSGDTIKSLATTFNVSASTIAAANGLSVNATLKEGQELIILPVSGLLHTVKSGNTVSELAKAYKSSVEGIIAYNDLKDEGDIFIGDELIIPGGIIPATPLPSISATVLPDSFFIFPVQGVISQGLHSTNGIDVANKCGTPIFAAAAGTVQRVKFDSRYGYYVTILHDNGVVTYYGHLEAYFVKSGDRVDVGDRIASIGKTGTMSTGCHLHFQVMGAKNPLAKYKVGTSISY